MIELEGKGGKGSVRFRGTDSTESVGRESATETTSSAIFNLQESNEREPREYSVQSETRRGE